MQLPAGHHLRSASRQVIAAMSTLLPREASIRTERWLRGYEDAGMLARADGVIVSYGKSGRTWLRVMISRYFATKYGIPDGRMMVFDNFHRWNAKIPKLFFTHDNYINDYLGTERKLDIYGKSRVVLLVRDPRDTAVSWYFQWKYRMLRRKKVINRAPLEDPGIYDFIAGEAAGVPKIIRFLNTWAKDLDRFPELIVVKYEDLRSDARHELGRILIFLGETPSPAELDDCVSYASVENMRRMETENAGRWLANRRLRPGNANDPSSFKVRRAKVGGWRDYVSEDEAHQIDAMLRERLSPVFGYNQPQVI